MLCVCVCVCVCVVSGWLVGEKVPLKQISMGACGEGAEDNLLLRRFLAETVLH